MRRNPSLEDIALPDIDRTVPLWVSILKYDKRSHEQSDQKSESNIFEIHHFSISDTADPGPRVQGSGVVLFSLICSSLIR